MKWEFEATDSEITSRLHLWTKFYFEKRKYVCAKRLIVRLDKSPLDVSAFALSAGASTSADTVRKTLMIDEHWILCFTEIKQFVSDEIWLSAACELTRVICLFVVVIMLASPVYSVHCVYIKIKPNNTTTHRLLSLHKKPFWCVAWVAHQWLLLLTFILFLPADDGV